MNILPTPIEWLKISIANNFGKDKLSLPDRLNWFETEFKVENLSKAEEPNQAKSDYLALSEVLATGTTSHLISLDATASVLQLIAVITNCRETAQLSNVIGHTRNDPYTIIHKATGLAEVPRKKCKEAIMTASYGSTAIPQEVYGNHLDKFYEAMDLKAPAVMPYVEFTQDLWNPNAEYHGWVMPDGFEVMLPSMFKKSEVVNFRGTTVEVAYEELGCKAHSRELSANIIHSIDALIVREITARCGYSTVPTKPNLALEAKLDKLTEETGFKSARVLYLNPSRANEFVLPSTSFDVLTVHDAFRVSPLHANELRQQYNQVLYELANSKIFEYILSYLTEDYELGEPDYSWTKEILEADYSLT